MTFDLVVGEHYFWYLKVLVVMVVVVVGRGEGGIGN